MIEHPAHLSLAVSLPASWQLAMTSDGFRLAWTIAWQSTFWLALGLVVARLWRRRAARAHLLLMLATVGAVISPLLTTTVHRMEWGILPAQPVETPKAVDVAPLPVVPTANRLAELSPPDTSMPDESEPLVAMEDLPEAAASRPHAGAGSSKASESRDCRTAATLPGGPTSRRTFQAVIATCWLMVSFLLAIRLVFSLRRAGRIAQSSGRGINPQLMRGPARSRCGPQDSGRRRCWEFLLRHAAR